MNDSDFGELVRLKCFVEPVASSERVTAMNSVSVTLAFHVTSDCSAVNQCRINVKCLVSCMRVSKQAMHELWMPVTDT